MNGEHVSRWHMWKRQWWVRLWRAIYPSSEPAPNAEAEVARWAARAEAASARTAFITLIITFIGLAATLIVVNWTRLQVAALLEGIKPDLVFRKANANLCPGTPDKDKFKLEVENLGDGRARDVRFVFELRFEDGDLFLRVPQDYGATSELGPRQSASIQGEGIANFLHRAIKGLQPDVLDPVTKIKNMLVSSKYSDVIGTKYSGRKKDVSFSLCR